MTFPAVSIVRVKAKRSRREHSEMPLISVHYGR